MGTITYIDEVSIEHKRVLLRVDFDVPLSENHTVVDDTRIKETLPTIRLLLQKHNKLIILAKLGRPKTRDSQFSLKPIAEKLQELLSKYTVTFIDDFLTENKSTFENQKENEILFFENMRFYPEEKACDEMFAKKIASLGDVYI
ncbi:MAG: phosphoglycerate kinase, partial [Candidatus Levyibacteriota bacterium]